MQTKTVERIVNLISPSSIKEGRIQRKNCPVCKGKNTFTISRIDGAILYNCYRQACTFKGIVKRGLTKVEIREKIKQLKHPTKKETKEFVIPIHWQNIEKYHRALEYVRNNNIREAYDKGAIDLFYDPREERIVFMVNRGGVPYNAIGRWIYNYGTKPKWRVYSEPSLSFWPEAMDRDLRYPADVCVLVEDCASASALVPYVDSMALLGTNINQQVIKELKTFYKLVYIALDPDALKKGKELREKINPHIKTKLIKIDEEFKDMAPAKIIKLVLGL